ncbi:MAG TPA: group II truncated hemoglobin [Polyangiaceae bacterium]|nr:group II truncated hemoglobin [Polyangiaceae bacterium]
MAYAPTELDSPFARLGGEEPVRRLAECFYDQMDATEPELAKLHELDAEGRVCRRSRDFFALFLIEWLGGPRNFTATRGHPRLRMRHGAVPVDERMRDAWLRCMGRALDAQGVSGDVRAFLDVRFAEVANFLRNVPG